MLSFGIVVSLRPVAAVTFTLMEALNAAYGVEETRSRRKRFVFALVFGSFLAFAFIVASGLMLIEPRVAGWLAGLAGRDEAWVAFWGWLRLPVALFLLAAVLSVFYRFAPDTDDLSGLRRPAPSSPSSRGRSLRWGSLSTCPDSPGAA